MSNTNELHKAIYCHTIYDPTQEGHQGLYRRFPKKGIVSLKKVASAARWLRENRHKHEKNQN